MKIAFLADPLDHFKIAKDSTCAMMRAGAGCGHTIFHFQSVSLLAGRVVADASRLTLSNPSAANWYAVEESTPLDLSDFDAVVLRRDPPFDMRYVVDTWLLELAKNQGARLFNDPRAIRDHNEKLAIAQFTQFTAPTLVSNNARLIRDFHAEHRDVILKPLDGMGGAGIFRIRDDGLNLGSAIELISNNGREPIMAQRYIPEIKQGDKRILLIAGEPIPYALARIPQANEVRGNLAAGGTGVAQPLSARDLEIANTLGPILAARGLFLVGLDVIGDYLTEVNVTSPTCFQEIAKQTGFDVARRFIEALEMACSQALVHGCRGEVV